MKYFDLFSFATSAFNVYLLTQLVEMAQLQVVRKAPAGKQYFVMGLAVLLALGVFLIMRSLMNVINYLQAKDDAERKERSLEIYKSAFNIFSIFICVSLLQAFIFTN